MNNIRKITSSDNNYFKKWKKLLTSKGLKDPDYPFCISSGNKLTRELLDLSIKDKVTLEALIVSENSIQDQSAALEKLEPYQKNKIPVYSLPQILFKELDILGTQSPLLLVEQPHLQTWDPAAEPQGMEVILPLGDPNNLGAAIRSATAFGASKIILTSDAAHPFLPKSIKASSGTVFLCDLYHSQNFKTLTGPLVTLDLHGTSLKEFQWPKNVRLLVGEEGQGVPNYECSTKKTISIPMQNGVESLNANVSLSIALYEYQRLNSF